MSISGHFTTTETGIAGEIRFFGAREQVVLRRVEKTENEKSPDFRILAADDERIDYGAAWAKTSKDERNYISLKLDSPLFAGPTYPTLNETEATGEYDLVWSR